MKRFFKSAPRSVPPKKKAKVVNNNNHDDAMDSVPTPPDMPEDYPYLRSSRQFEQLSHVFLPACGRFSASPNSAWDTTLMTLKEAVNYHILCFFAGRRVREENRSLAPFSMVLARAIGDSLPPEITAHVRSFLVGDIIRNKPGLFIASEDELAPFSRNHSARGDRPHQVEALHLHENVPPPPCFTWGLNLQTHKAGRLWVGDLHVFGASEPPLSAEWGQVAAARLTLQQPYQSRMAYFRNYHQALFYLRRAKAYFFDEVGKFGPREKAYAKRLARILAPFKPLGSHERDEWYWATATQDEHTEATYLGEIYANANALLAEYHGYDEVDYFGVGCGKWVYYSGADALPFNLKPHRTGWIRRRWFCDCAPCTPDEECPHACWWPGYGPGQCPRLIRPLSRKAAIRRSIFGCLPNMLTQRATEEDLQYFFDFREHFFRLSDKGLRMERNHLVGPANITLAKEEGKRYEQAERVRRAWLLPEDDDFEEGAWHARGPHTIEPTRPMVQAMYLADVVRDRPQRRGPTLDHLKLRASMLKDLRKATADIRKLLAEPSRTHEFLRICYPGDPDRTVPFETLVLDFSLPHTMEASGGQLALYTRYTIQWPSSPRCLLKCGGVPLYEFAVWYL
jgi:hypothetical protein